MVLSGRVALFVVEDVVVKIVYCPAAYSWVCIKLEKPGGNVQLGYSFTGTF